MTTETKPERRRRTIHRIHRIQGQLAALEASIEADKQCEDLVVQARAIEKAVASLINHMLGGYLQHQGLQLMKDNPELAAQEIERIVQLINR